MVREPTIPRGGCYCACVKRSGNRACALESRGDWRAGLFGPLQTDCEHLAVCLGAAWCYTDSCCFWVNCPFKSDYFVEEWATTMISKSIVTWVWHFPDAQCCYFTSWRFSPTSVQLALANDTNKLATCAFLLWILSRFWLICTWMLRNFANLSGFV